MTPAQQKAAELIVIYLRLEDDTLFYWNGYYDRQMLDEEVLGHAKRCAIIHVEGILERYEFWVKQFSSLFQSSFEVEIKFWQEVKKELTI